ncbi:replication protein A 32 kDa subunit A [Trifolium repens]|nr:replication protein A 32 kDa subunit A [Trifolium repens]
MLYPRSCYKYFAGFPGYAQYSTDGLKDIDKLVIDYLQQHSNMLWLKLYTLTMCDWVQESEAGFFLDLARDGVVDLEVEK